jgi:uncharacterized protein YkwD
MPGSVAKRAQGAPRIMVFLFLTSTFAAASVTSTKMEIITTQPTPSVSPELTDEKTFRAAILNSTNAYRAQHNASAVSWNETLEAFAVNYLDIVVTTSSNSRRDNNNNSSSDIRQDLNHNGSNIKDVEKDSDDTCKFAHSGGPYGENLALGCSDATSCVQMWGDERRLYNYDDPSFSHETGHFTQLVWKSTTTVGCGRKLCGNHKGWYLVCEYWPRGNVIGAFDKEVGRPVAEVGGNSGHGKGEDGLGDGNGDGGNGDGKGKEKKGGLPPWLVAVAFVFGVGIGVCLVMS